MFYCVASPYSGTEEVQKERVEETARLTFELIKMGIHVFSLTLHNDAVFTINQVNKADYAQQFAKNANAIILQSNGLIVLKLSGWENSHGIQVEMERAQKNGIPVIKLSPEDILNRRGDMLKLL